jgi:hypothetical protein
MIKSIDNIADVIENNSYKMKIVENIQDPNLT